ncbi:hypothetical protein OUZ56_021092 [Daphnia magna]|uniref:Uncharacterized protein n=1 Tax=Daphnia magna TaxID=35525 RepID=A0ABQ9ZGE5_9CRUS|nr:hypothetical protein OUZ56_021092 [Daphnia magna]
MRSILVLSIVLLSFQSEEQPQTAAIDLSSSTRKEELTLYHFEEDAQMRQALAKHCKASSPSFLILIRSCVMRKRLLWRQEYIDTENG